MGFQRAPKGTEVQKVYLNKSLLRTSLTWEVKWAFRSRRERERSPTKINKNRSTPRHLIVKLANSKDKEKILKAARDKKSLNFVRRSIRVTADLSTETWQARKGWQGIFRVLNEKNLQPRILYPARLSFRIEGDIKSFQDRKN